MNYGDEMIMRKHISIQTKIMIFFTILTIVLFITVALLFFKSTKYAINTSKENELSTLARETGNKVERFLVERYGDIQVMAKSPILNNDNISKNLKLQYIETVRKAYQTYDYIFIIDEKGDLEVFSGSKNPDQTYKAWINQVLHGQIYVSDFIYDESDKAYAVYFAAPIMEDRGVISGAVVERMNFQAISEIVSNVQLGKSGYAYLADNTGKVMFLPGNRYPDHYMDFFQQHHNVAYIDHDDTKYISAYYEIEKYDTQKSCWYLVVEEPMKEAFEVTSRLRNYTIVVILSTISALLVLAIIMSKLITKPITALVKDTQNILDGDISKNIRIESGDEIGRLAQSFNMLLSNLKAMEQQVLEKSGEAESLAEIRQYVENFFDNIPSAVITVDTSGKINTFNHTASKITGIEQAHLLGKSINEPLPENLISLITLLKDGFERETMYIKHIVKLKCDYEIEVSIMINTFVQKDNTGKVLGVIGVFRSVEAIKNFEESVVRAKNLASLGELSAGMAHEIRNPLTSIKGYAQLIKSELGENHELTPDISVIVSEVDRLNGIIDRFLTFARPNQPQLEPININDIINAMYKLICQEAEQSGIEVVIGLSNVPVLLLDFEQIEQALLNICLNAIQAMPFGGSLKILTRFSASMDVVIIEISDTGAGIKKDNHDLIFQPFFTTKDKGTGLGLAICLRIVENHKGFIEVNSVEGSGTAFVIKFPVNNLT